MKSVRGFYLPDSEQHLVPFLENGPTFAGGPTYQLHKLEAAMKWVKRFEHAVDVGAHCGLWSRVLAHKFQLVTAFEPVAAHRECFVKNVPVGSAVVLHDYALGDKPGSVRLATGPASSGDTRVQDAGEHQAVMRTLDSMVITPIDFLKIDCEGYEYFVIAGGEQIIRNDRPCVIVEQKRDFASKRYGIGNTEAVALLQSWGARQRFEISGDYCLSWD